MWFKVHVFVLFVTFLSISLQFCVGFARFKRADIDLQSCINNFDVHKDKIIRTQDSQKMGAKYLNEIDLGTREECLRLCCETDECDVFVFEEKKSGSCYLFHCGPPEDFKCKFTHHVNYSSAVLAINRHLPDLESQIKLTKHEQDLSKLRKPELHPEVVPQIAETHATLSTTSTTTQKSKEIMFPPVEMKTKPPEEARKCSRYQFECRSTSECIAIYNACDGIPQCADGSDEAPELGCPESLTTLPPVLPPRKNLPPPRYPTNSLQSPARIQPLPEVLPQREVYRPQEAHQDADFLRVGPQFNAQPSWGARQGALPPYPADKNSRIFTHKENGLQVPDGQEISQIPFEGREQYPKIPTYYDNYRQPNPQDNWQGGSPEENQYSGYIHEPLKNWQPAENPPPDLRSAPLYKSVSVDQPFEAPEAPPKENPKHVQDKMANELKGSKGAVESEKVPKIKLEKPKAPYNDVAAFILDEAAELPDGIAQTSGGAVVSLTLGLIITSIVALVVICRLRIKRKMRKGGKSYAHDSDYLVNGMYL